MGEGVPPSKGWRGEERRGEGQAREKGGCPLHKLYLTAPAGARLFRTRVRMHRCILYALLYNEQRALASNVRFTRRARAQLATSSPISFSLRVSPLLAHTRERCLRRFWSTLFPQGFEFVPNFGIWSTFDHVYASTIFNVCLTFEDDHGAYRDRNLRNFKLF